MADLNKYMRDTKKRLVIGAVFFIVVIGDGLIFLIYGTGPGLMGLACLLAGFLPVLLILVIIFFIDWSVKRANRE